MNQEMMAAPLLRPIITEKGLAAANQAATLGKAVVISHVTMSAVPGEASYTDETLVGQGELLAVADGRVVSPTQVNISALVPDTYPTTDVCGIAFYLNDGTLFAIYREPTPILYHKTGETLLLGLDFVMSNIPSDSVIVESTGANLVFGDWVPETRRVNGKNLAADVMLNAADVNAAPSGFGLGEEQAYTVGDMNTDPMTWNGGKIGWVRGISSTLNKPLGVVGVAIFQRYQQGAPSAGNLMYFAGERLFTRRWSGSAWADWVELYSTANKPTPEDIGAAPQSDTYTKKQVDDKDATRVPVTRSVNGKALDKDLTLTLTDLGYTAPDLSGYVPNTRRVNGKNLAADVMLNAADVNAAPSGFGLGGEQAYTVEDMDTDPMTWNGGKMGWVRATSGTIGKPIGISGTAIFQRYMSGSTSAGNLLYFANYRTFTRYWSGSAWSDWAELYSTAKKPTPADIGAVATVDLVGLAIGKPKSLTSENLNDLGVGVYKQTMNTNPSAELNYPENQAGALTCYETVTGRFVQEYRPYASNKTYTRIKTSSSWGSWALTYNTHNKPSPEDIGAAPAAHSHGQYALNSLKINGYQLTGDFNLNAANVGAYPLTGGRLNGGVLAAGAIETEFASIRGWSSTGLAAFSQKQQTVDDGVITGTTSTTHNMVGRHVIEYVTGVTSSANVEQGAHALWATDGKGFARLWLLRNSGALEAPNGAWSIDGGGMLHSSSFGGSIAEWIATYYAPKNHSHTPASIGAAPASHNHSALQGNYDIVTGQAAMVGCYAMLGTFLNTTGKINPGMIIQGVHLMWTNSEGTTTSNVGYGSWMALGHANGDRDYGVWNVTLWIRVA